jgi:hypothetical protein
MNWYEDKTYWEMCKKAVELQDIVEFQYLKLSGTLSISGVYVDGVGQFYVEDGDDMIWLPTQEELQKIIIDKGYFKFSLLKCFYNFTKENIKEFSSNELNKLWLAFIMSVLNKKKWNFETKEWVTKNKKLI